MKAGERTLLLTNIGNERIIIMQKDLQGFDEGGMKIMSITKKELYRLIGNYTGDSWYVPRSPHLLGGGSTSLLSEKWLRPFYL